MKLCVLENDSLCWTPVNCCWQQKCVMSMLMCIQIWSGNKTTIMVKITILTKDTLPVIVSARRSYLDRIGDWSLRYLFCCPKLTRHSFFTGMVIPATSRTINHHSHDDCHHHVPYHCLNSLVSSHDHCAGSWRRLCSTITLHTSTMLLRWNNEILWVKHHLMSKILGVTRPKRQLTVLSRREHRPCSYELILEQGYCCYQDFILYKLFLRGWCTFSCMFCWCPFFSELFFPFQTLYQHPLSFEFQQFFGYRVIVPLSWNLSCMLLDVMNGSVVLFHSVGDHKVTSESYMCVMPICCVTGVVKRTCKNERDKKVFQIK